MSSTKNSRNTRQDGYSRTTDLFPRPDVRDGVTDNRKAAVLVGIVSALIQVQRCLARMDRPQKDERVRL